MAGPRLSKRKAALFKKSFRKKLGLPPQAMGVEPGVFSTLVQRLRSKRKKKKKRAQ